MRTFQFDAEEQKTFDAAIEKIKHAASNSNHEEVVKAALQLVELGYDYCDERIDLRDYADNY